MNRCCKSASKGALFCIVRFKFGFIELYVMHLSLPGERKVPKERHLRKVPTVLSLRILSPYLRAHLPVGKWADTLLSRSLPWGRTPVGVTAARLATHLAETNGFSLPDKENSNLGQKQRDEFRAVGAPPSVRVFGSWRLYARSDSFAGWRKSRADLEDGYLRKKPWVSSLSGVLSVAFCRHGQKAT